VIVRSRLDIYSDQMQDKERRACVNFGEPLTKAQESDLLAAAIAESLAVAEPATCNVLGCSRVTWNGKSDTQCCRTCKSSSGARHGPECDKKLAADHHAAEFSFYHATTLEAALQIQELGFRVPTGPSEQKGGALLGPGVYCTVTLQKAMKYCDGPHGGIIFELAVDLGQCKTLGQNDPMMTTWQQHGYDSAWAPTGAGGRGTGLEENCIKDPKRIKIKQAIAGHSYKLRQAGYHIVGGKILKMARE